MDDVPQVGALCYRIRKGKPQFLLITSRTRGRWIVPKGWLMKGTPDTEVAAIEAWEEAGVRGEAAAAPIGTFHYLKLGDDGGPDRPCLVEVFPIRVKSLKNDFPERSQRRRRWFSRKEAARRVDEPELQSLIQSFTPAKP